jgi:hypothetical protein
MVAGSGVCRSATVVWTIYRGLDPRPRVCGVGLLLLCAALVTAGGCGGCSRKPNAQGQDAQKKKQKEDELAKRNKEEKQKPDFDIQRVLPQPGDRDNLLLAVKPGHWVAATQEMKTNHFDFSGELEAAVVDKEGRPINLAGTPFRLTTTRPASLPKGQTKFMELVVFVPHASTTTRISSVLRGKGGGGEIPSAEFFSAMPPYQYFLVVLAREPDRYGYVKVLDVVQSPWDDATDFQPVLYYRVVMPKVDERVPLPSHPLAWTSIAYLLWDDMEPSVLTSEQQTALVDWLHWGGQLVVSGPSSIDSLLGSYLGAYLPVTAAKARQYSADDLQELSKQWSVPMQGRTGLPLVASAKWSGVEFTLHAEGAAVAGTGGLVVERDVGRGRIVVSAFSLAERELTSWRSFDSFFNGCLLRRPSRRYEILPGSAEVSLTWNDSARHRLDSAISTEVRYLTRDTGRALLEAPFEPDARRMSDERTIISKRKGDPIFGRVWTGPSAPRRDLNLSPQQPGGVASWNPQSETAEIAREMLTKAAGIAIPRAGFVVWVLALYLVVLVPLNWMLFQAIGRIEWAWIAAPAIAISCAAAVIKLAQLDIGFARSQTEIAVLEVQRGYGRGHLTRYLALYTSLSTSYDLSFADRSGVAQPFPNDDFQLLRGQTLSTVNYQRHQAARLTGLRVGSNSTSMVHSEQMIDVGGRVTLGKASTGTPQVHNGTHWNLADVIVARKRIPPGGKERMEYCKMGDIRSQNSASVAFSITDEKTLFSEEFPVTSSDPSRQLDLERLVRAMIASQNFQLGDVRLIGRIAEALPGLEVEPAAPQVRGATLIVAHLARHQRPAPQPDVNTRADFQGAASNRAEDEAAEQP